MRVCVHVCMVCCMFVNVHNCDCVIESVVCVCTMCCVCVHTYLIHVSKKTNTLNIDINLYRGYTFVYSLYIDTYITELQGNSLIDVRFIYTRIAEQFTYIC